IPAATYAGFLREGPFQVAVAIRASRSQGSVIRASRPRGACQWIRGVPASVLTRRWKSREVEATCMTWLKPQVEHSTPQTASILWAVPLARLRRNYAAFITWVTFPLTIRKIGN